MAHGDCRSGKSATHRKATRASARALLRSSRGGRGRLRQEPLAVLACAERIEGILGLDNSRVIGILSCSSFSRGSRMASAIDPTKPVDGLPAVKADLRQNLQAAK